MAAPPFGRTFEPRIAEHLRKHPLTTNLKGARVLVAGATGFLGQYVSAVLSSVGVHILPVSRRVGYDFRYEEEALQAALVARPDIVIHLVASGAPGSAEAFETSLRAGLNLVRAAALCRARFVAVSRPGEPGSLEEIARASLLGLCRAYAKEHRFAFVQLVPCAMYGPLDRPGPGRTISTILETLMDAKAQKAPSVVLQGHPEAPCPLVFAGDVAEAVVAACALPGCHEPLNVVPEGEPDTFKGIVERLARLIGYNGKVSFEGTDGWCTPPKGLSAREILDWAARTPLEAGLSDTVRWRLGQATKEEKAPSESTAAAAVVEGVKTGGGRA